jgi:hypothetical protein
MAFATPAQGSCTRVYSVCVAALLGVCILCVISPALEAQQTTLRFHADPTIIDVTFDAANVRIEDVKKWMQLRDYISNENGYQVPVSLEECHKEDPRYVDCGIDRGSLNIHDARLNMDKTRKNFADLDSEAFSR